MFLDIGEHIVGETALVCPGDRNHPFEVGATDCAESRGSAETRHTGKRYLASFLEDEDTVQVGQGETVFFSEPHRDIVFILPNPEVSRIGPVDRGADRQGDVLGGKPQHRRFLAIDFDHDLGFRTHEIILEVDKTQCVPNLAPDILGDFPEFQIIIPGNLDFHRLSHRRAALILCKFDISAGDVLDFIHRFVECLERRLGAFIEIIEIHVYTGFILRIAAGAHTIGRCGNTRVGQRGGKVRKRFGGIFELTRDHVGGFHPLTRRGLDFNPHGVGIRFREKLNSLPEHRVQHDGQDKCGNRKASASISAYRSRTGAGVRTVESPLHRRIPNRR